jgi:hypothetical protein
MEGIVDQNYEAVLRAIKHRDEIYPLIEGGPLFAWCTMIYACMSVRPSPETKGCGWEHRVWCAIGCEGPPQAKVPVPMFCGKCPKCGGTLGHDRWNEDDVFTQDGVITFKPIPPDVAFFRLPTLEEARKNAARGYWGAEYQASGGDVTAKVEVTPAISPGGNRAQRRGQTSSRSYSTRRR